MIRAGWLSERFTDAVSDELGSIAAVQLAQPTNYHREQSDLDRARQAGAQLAVAGKIAVSGDDLSASGEMFDVASGNSLGTFKNEGKARDLFNVQDATARQVKQLVERVTLPRGSASVAGINSASRSSDSVRYNGSDLQRSVDGSDRSSRSSADSRYDADPHHRTYVSPMQYLVPYYTNYYGYRSYSPWYPGYSPSYYGGWNGWGSGPIVVINNSFNRGQGSSSSGGRGPTIIRTPVPRITQAPTEIDTRTSNGSLVPAPTMPNTIQKTPSYEIRPPTR
jgi:hypothetical protein